MCGTQFLELSFQIKYELPISPNIVIEEVVENNPSTPPVHIAGNTEDVRV